jgi:hypothetical protein
VIGKYITYYKYKNDSEYYPKFRKREKVVTYDDDQLDLLERYLSNNLTDEDCVEMGINEDIIEANFFKLQYKDLSSNERLNVPRSIGNIGVNPPKFAGIVSEYISSGRVKTVIYSNFYKSGIMRMSEYLRKRGIEHEIYTPEKSLEEKVGTMKRFDENENGILLLHPQYYEGISLRKVRMLHVLEPLIESYKEEQLYTRVIRYNSHVELPESSRNVEMVSWSSRSINMYKRLLLKYRKVGSISEGIDMIESLMDLVVNPESEVKSIMESNSKELEEVRIFLSKVDESERMDTASKCCIYPYDKCEERKGRCIEYWVGEKKRV